jgi:hypothetical protein
VVLLGREPLKDVHLSVQLLLLTSPLALVIISPTHEQALSNHHRTVANQQTRQAPSRSNQIVCLKEYDVSQIALHFRKWSIQIQCSMFLPHLLEDELLPSLALIQSMVVNFENF